MFNDFFYRLRDLGVSVSTTEWLTFQEALKLGLHDSTFTGFYELCRAILCKSESDYDAFQEAFLSYFENVLVLENGDLQRDHISEKMLQWVNDPGRNGQNRIIRKTAEDITEEMKNYTREDIEIKFRRRQQRQQKEHNGGYHYVGTHGISPFGNTGFNENGIRVGGTSMNKTALRVAGERAYRDFREDNVLSIRQFQMAFRRLRRYSEQAGTEEEFDIDRTIHDTCQKGGMLQIRYKKPRRNNIKVLLLMDSGGSMGPYSKLCSQLFQAANRSNRFKDLKVYYFHNCIGECLYTNPTLEEKYAVITRNILRDCDPEYRVIIVGDAAMEMSDLTFHPLESTRNNMGYCGLQWLQHFLDRYPYIVWLTPYVLPADRLFGPWGQTYKVIDELFHIRPLTVAGLEESMKSLLVKS